jgi:hypothetical protein
LGYKSRFPVFWDIPVVWSFAIYDLCYAVCTMAKARKKAEHPTLPLAEPTPPPMPQVGDRVIPARSDSEWKVTGVWPEGKFVDLELPGTKLTRFRVAADTLKFTDSIPQKLQSPSKIPLPFLSALQRTNARIFSGWTMTLRYSPNI